MPYRLFTIKDIHQILQCCTCTLGKDKHTVHLHRLHDGRIYAMCQARTKQLIHVWLRADNSTDIKNPLASIECSGNC